MGQAKRRRDYEALNAARLAFGLQTTEGPTASTPGAWGRETAKERKLRERGRDVRLICPPKPHEGPCFSNGMQTAACKNYPFNQWQAAIKRLLADGMSPDEVERRMPKIAEWQWHPGRGLDAQEQDNLLAQSLPVDSLEACARSLKILFHNRTMRSYHPADFAAAVRRLQEAQAALRARSGES